MSPPAPRQCSPLLPTALSITDRGEMLHFLPRLQTWGRWAVGWAGGTCIFSGFGSMKVFLHVLRHFFARTMP